MKIDKKKRKKQIDLDKNGKLKKFDTTLFNQESLFKYLEHKKPEYFCMKCYETNVLSLVPIEEQLFKLERKLKDIEKLFGRI